MLKRQDIVERLADNGYTKKNAGLIIDDMVKVITEAMVAGEDVQLHGFGTFRVKDIAPRETTDFKTKGRITIPTHKAPKFEPGAQLKRWVREGAIRD